MDVAAIKWWTGDVPVGSCVLTYARELNYINSVEMDLRYQINRQVSVDNNKCVQWVEWACRMISVD